MYRKFEELLKNNCTTSYMVSKKTGVCQSTLSDWKNGKYEPKLENLQKIAKHFNVPITYFLEEEKSTNE